MHALLGGCVCTLPMHALLGSCVCVHMCECREGSGNVICLDVLRATHTTPGALDAVYREINMTRGVDDRLDKYVPFLCCLLLFCFRLQCCR